ADVGERDTRLVPELEAERDAGHDLDHYGEVRDEADVAALVIREVHVLLAPRRGRIRLRHVLEHDIHGTGAHDEERAQGADRGSEDIAGAVRGAAQRVRAPHGRRLLSQRTVQTADDL